MIKAKDYCMKRDVSIRSDIKNLSSNLRNDTKLIKKLVRYCGCYMIKQASDELIRDKKLILDLIPRYEEIIRFLPKCILDDDFFMTAIQRNTRVLQYAPYKIRNNKDIVLEVLKDNCHNGYLLEYLSDELKNDYDIVEAAISNDGSNIIYASDNLRYDYDLLLLAIKNMRDNYDDFLMIFDGLEYDKDFIIECIKVNQNIFKYLDEQFKNDEDIIEILRYSQYLKKN